MEVEGGRGRKKKGTEGRKEDGKVEGLKGRKGRVSVLEGKKEDEN